MPPMIAHAIPEVSLVADTDFPVCHGEKFKSQCLVRGASARNSYFREGGSSANSIPDQARIVYRSGVVTKKQEGASRLSRNNGYGWNMETVVEASGRAAHIISRSREKVR